MILYNVTINIEEDAHPEWLEWMRSEYLPAVMKTGMFSGCKLCRILDSPNEGITYSVQYFCDSMSSYTRYQKEHNPRLQEMHLEKFRNKFVSFQSLMEITEEFSVSNFSLN